MLLCKLLPMQLKLKALSDFYSMLSALLPQLGLSKFDILEVRSFQDFTNLEAWM